MNSEFKRITWGEFDAMVNDHLALAAKIEGAESIVRMSKRAAILNLQRLIPAFQNGHEFLYHRSDFVEYGSALIGTLPPQGKLRNIWLELQMPITNTAETVERKRHGPELIPATAVISSGDDYRIAGGLTVGHRYRLKWWNRAYRGVVLEAVTEGCPGSVEFVCPEGYEDQIYVVFADGMTGERPEISLVEIFTDTAEAPYDLGTMVRYATVEQQWNDRLDLRDGLVALNDGKARVAMEPHGSKFWIYPAITNEDVVVVEWDGVKADFETDEATPFTELAAECVASYVDATIARKVENDPALATSYMNSFMTQRRGLYAELKEKSSFPRR